MASGIQMREMREPLLGGEAGVVRREEPNERSCWLVRWIASCWAGISAWMNRGKTEGKLAELIEKGDEAEAIKIIDQMGPKALVSRGRSKESFLFHATRKGRGEVVKALCARLTPEQIRARSSDGSNAFLIAKDLGREAVLAVLKSHFPRNEQIATNSDGYTTLMADIEHGKYERVLQAIPTMELDELMFVAKNGKTAFSLAVGSGDSRVEPILKLLLLKLPLAKILELTVPAEKFPGAAKLLEKRRAQAVLSFGAITKECSIGRATRNVYFDRNVLGLIAGFLTQAEAPLQTS